MTSVPAPSLGPLVGRELELARVRTLFAEGQRLVTLLGPPGIGKTRLAVTLAQDEADAVWVELAHAEGADDIVSRIALALDVRTSWVELEPSRAPEVPWLDELAWALETRSDVVLVLDEAEHAAPALARVLTRLLALAPQARAIVTSRERLGIPGESFVEIGPLSVEAHAAEPSVAALLLMSRAGLHPKDPAERSALEDVARALDGVPLAIELAAARLHVLAPGELLARLPAHLDLPRGAGAMTLREALDSSWRRLGDAEKTALRRCAIFRGAFDLDAAEAVLGDDALAALQSLRDRSLVAREPDGRFRLYASVRQFAAEQTTPAGEDALALHAAHFASFVTRELEAFRRGDPRAPLRLVTVLGDLEAAHASADPSQRTTLLLGIASARIDRVASTELVARLDDALRDADSVVVSALHELRGRALESAGRIEEAVASYERALAASPTPDERALHLARLAHAELARGDVARAHEHAAEAHRVAPSSSLARVRAARILGLVVHARGELDEARDAYVEALDLARELGLPTEIAGLRADLGGLRLQQRRLEEAREDYDAALAGLDPELDPIKLGLAEGNLAILEQEEGRAEQAEALYARAIERLQRAGHRLYTAHLLVYAGALAHEHDRFDEALVRYEAARSSLRRVGDARLLALASALAGAAESARGRRAAADEAFAESERALGRVDDAGVTETVRIHRAHRAIGEDDPHALATLASVEGSPALQTSDDLRLAVRLLRRRLGHGRLRVDLDARTLVLPDGTAIELANRAVLWRLVESLLARRQSAPGDPLEIDAMIDAGWPGERMTGESALNRLKVALSTLRKLGLREVLVRHDSGGYLLDPDVPLVRE